MLVGGCLQAGLEAREWELPGGKRVVANATALDMSSVLLVTKNGQQVRLGIQQLAQRDLAYLKDLVTVKQGAVSQRSLALQQQSVDVQSAQYWSQWYDLWVVQFNGPRGPFWKLVPARNSEQATNIAWRQNPRASLLWVKRLNRK